MNLNPYESPRGTANDEPRFPNLGRNDCPVCATKQHRFAFVNPWHGCRRCGSFLRLKVAGWVHVAYYVPAAYLYLRFAPNVSQIYLGAYEFCVCYVACISLVFHLISLAIGRIYVVPTKPRTGLPPGFFLKFLGWGCVVLGTAFTVIFYRSANNSVMPILAFFGFCVALFFAFMLLAGKTSPQGHLEPPALLRPTQNKLISLVVAIALGAAIGGSLIFLS